MIHRGIIFVFFLWFVAGCIPSNQKHCIKEGIIEYEIRFSDDIIERNTATNLLPKKMVLTFDRQYAKTTITGFMGLFTMGLITNLNTRKSETFVKIFDKKYVYYGDANEPSVIFAHHPPMQFRYLADSLTLAGFRSAKALSVYGQTEVPVAYTNAICIDGPNCNNPFDEINGVLTEFYVVMNSYTLFFKAANFRNEEVKRAEFSLDDSYNSISREKMQKIIDELLP